MSLQEAPADGSMHNPQPRRYRVRKLHDVDGLTQAQIATELGVNQSTVARDLKTTVAPSGKTPGGAPVYPLGRFNDDPEHRERIERLCKEYPETVARRIVAGEFAGEPSGQKPLMRGQVERLRSEESRVRELRGFDERPAAA
jgi:predicted transcriptional regulator